MVEPNSAAWTIYGLSVAFISIMLALHPGAASGASFGCFFLLALPDPLNARRLEIVLRKMAMLIFSWGWGYSMGSGHAADGGNYAMAMSIGHSAMAAGIFGSLNLMFRNDGPLPPWLAAIVDRIPILRKGGGNG